jgi:two-component system, NtrC family, sensor kinase
MPNECIFIVDDEAGIVRLCQRVLERAGYTVFPFTNPQKALESILAEAPDLLLTDIRMPAMDGFELTSQCKAISPDMVVLMMTGYGTMEMAIHALQKGVDGLLLKPFEPLNDLVTAVEQALRDAAHRRDSQRLQALRPLFEVSETLLTETEILPLSELIHASIKSLIHSSKNGCVVVSTDEEILYNSLNCDPDIEITLEDLQEFFQALDLKEGTVVVEEESLADLPGQSMMQKMQWKAAAITKVKRQDRIYFLFAVRTINDDHFSESDIEAFRILSRQIITALENARLYDELRKNIRSLEESQAALVQAEKMAAVGRLTASVAHEVNNPLQSIRNCIHLAGLDAVDAEHRREYLDLAQGELERLARIVQGMLEFSRPSSLKTERVDIVWLMKRTLDLVNAQLRERQVHTNLKSAENEVFVVCVREQIQQVIFNIILNAIDAMQTVEERNIWIEVQNQDDKVILLVEDSGPGIPAGLEHRIFEPFISTKPDGTGLGLAVSYGIMKAHHGHLSVVPGTHGSGACFEMVFGGS